MRKLLRNWRILVGCGMLMLVTAGCFQDINDAESQNVVSQLNTLTPSDTPLPTNTPEPTETPTNTPEPIVAESDLDVPVSDVGGGVTEVAQLDTPAPEGDTDTWALTATQIVAEITQTWDASFTQTQQALLGSFTLTPTPTATIELAPGITPSATLIAAPPGTVCIHEVKAGENLFRLSMTYGVSVQELASASGVVNINQIWVGDKINIPNCGTTGVFPPPTSTATFIAQPVTGTGVTGTGVDTSAQTASGTTPVVGGTTHVVQQYETLFQISMTYGVPVASIANANGITDINNILMGTQLIIPSQ